jgi:hypothetical protein
VAGDSRGRFGPEDETRAVGGIFMCSAKKATMALRAATAVMTFGASEAARVAKPTRDVIEKTESIVNKKVFGGSGETAAGLAPWDRTAPTDAGLNTPPPDPTPTPTPDVPEPAAIASPGVSNLAEQRRRRRLASLRMGIMGNIRAGGGGDPTTANLLTPAASGGGAVKTLLGQ